MEAAGILIGIIVLLGLFFVVWAGKNFKRDDSSMEEVLNSEMPYKLEPTEVSESGKYPPLEKLQKEEDEDNHRNDITDGMAFPAHLWTIKPTKSPLDNGAEPDEYKPKRKYTKRSKFWATNKPAKRMQKARAAKRKVKSK